MMRVVMLLHSLRRGGLERVVVSAANGLHRRGLRMGICCLHQAGALANTVDDGVESIVLHARPHDVTLPFRIRRVLKRFAPDVIHTVDFCSWPDTTLASLWLPGIARVHSFHGFLSVPPRRWRATGHLLTRRMHALHAVGAEAGNRAADYFGIDPTRIEIIPNGVDLQRFQRRDSVEGRPQHRAAGRPFTCLTVASLTRAKNPLLMVEVARRVHDPVRFVWIGDGPLRGELQASLARAGLSDRFLVPGSVEDVRPWLADADLFVLPSDTEAVPLSVLEAMAMQLPVVATRTGAVEEMAGANGAGLLADTGDAIGIAAAINRLRVDPHRRRRMGTWGRQAVQRHYRMDTMLDRYRDLYARASSSGRVVVTAPIVPAGVP